MENISQSDDELDDLFKKPNHNFIVDEPTPQDEFTKKVLSTLKKPKLQIIDQIEVHKESIDYIFSNAKQTKDDSENEIIRALLPKLLRHVYMIQKFSALHACI